jgi:hypothetical protein
MVGQYLCIRDLYSFSRVSKYTSAIACSLYLHRHNLFMSSVSDTLRLGDDKFQAVDIWYRSSGFAALRLLQCTFNSNVERAAIEMGYICKLLNSFLVLPRSGVGHIRLDNVETASLQNTRVLLAAVSATHCRALTMTGVVFQGSLSGMRRIEGAISFRHLLSLTLTDCSLSPSQWMNFLSSIAISCLRMLHITGPTSMIAVSDFLLRHHDLYTLRFERSLWKDAPSFSRGLRLPRLQTLQGYCFQVLYVLSSFASPPFLRELVIEANPPVYPRQPDYFDEVVHCLTMCQGSPTLQILLSERLQSSPLTLDSARARATCKLRSNKLLEIKSLCIGFVNMNDSIPVRSYSVNDSPPILTPLCRFYVSSG